MLARVTASPPVAPRFTARGTARRRSGGGGCTPSGSANEYVPATGKTPPPGLAARRFFHPRLGYGPPRSSRVAGRLSGRVRSLSPPPTSSAAATLPDLTLSHFRFGAWYRDRSSCSGGFALDRIAARFPRIIAKLPVARRRPGHRHLPRAPPLRRDTFHVQIARAGEGRPRIRRLSARADFGRPSHYGTLRKLWWWFDFIILVKLARLRFIAILAVIGAAILYWDTLVAYYEKWTRPVFGEEHATSGEFEYFCPMHPQVVTDNPKEKCPICAMNLSKRKKGETATAEALPAGVVTRLQLSPYKVVTAGIRTWDVNYESLTKTIETVGKVQFDERRLSRISARVKGRLDKLYANVTGQMVHPGDPLADIYSPSLVSTVQDLLNARATNATRNLCASGYGAGALTTIRSGPWKRQESRSLMSRFDRQSKDTSSRKYAGLKGIRRGVLPRSTTSRTSPLSGSRPRFTKTKAVFPQGRAEHPCDHRGSLPNRVFSGKLTFVHPAHGRNQPDAKGSLRRR